MIKQANKNWQRACTKAQKCQLQNQGSFGVLVRVGKNDENHGDEDSGWILHPLSEPTPLQNGAVWYKSLAGLPVNVLVEVEKED